MADSSSSSFSYHSSNTPLTDLEGLNSPSPLLMARPSPTPAQSLFISPANVNRQNAYKGRGGSPFPSPPLHPYPDRRLIGSPYFVIAQQDFVVPQQSEKCPFLWMQLYCPFMPPNIVEEVANNLNVALNDYCTNMDHVQFSVVIPRHKKETPIFLASAFDNELFHTLPGETNTAMIGQLNAAAKSKIKQIRYSPFPAETPEEIVIVNNLPKPWEFDIEAPGSVFYWINSSNGLVFVAKLKQPVTKKKTVNKISIVSNLGNSSGTATGTDRGGTNEYEPPLEITYPHPDNQCVACGTIWENFVKHDHKEGEDRSTWSYLGCTCNRWMCKNPCIMKWKECTFGQSVINPDDYYCPFCLFCHSIDCKGHTSTNISPSRTRALYAVDDDSDDWGEYGQCKDCMVVYHSHCASIDLNCRYCGKEIELKQ
jgi:hypothetical protein